MNRLTLVSAAFVASLASLQSARAVLISGDFVRTQSGVTTAPVSGDTAATGTLKNAVGYQFTGQVGTWNGLNLGNNNTSPMSFTSGLLNDGNGNPTTVQFRILNSGVPNPNNPANILPGYRVGSSTVNTTAPHLRYEYASIHTGAGTQLYMNWLITGLPANTLHDLIIFGAIDDATAQPANDNPFATMTGNGIAGVRDDERDWNWTGLTDASGQIAIRIEIPPTAGGQQSRYYGFQLQTAAATAATPEPATALFAVCGLAGLALRRRRLA